MGLLKFGSGLSKSSFVLNRTNRLFVPSTAAGQMNRFVRLLITAISRKRSLARLANLVGTALGAVSIRAARRVARRRSDWDTRIMYSAVVLEHCEHPRNFRDLLDATNTVNVTNPLCDDDLRLAVRIENGRSAAARCRTRRCTTAVPTSSPPTTL